MNKPISNRKVSVEIPKQEQETTRYGHIAVIAVVCFIVGVSWPFLAGVKLVPNVPRDEAAIPLDSPQAPSGPSAVVSAPEPPRSKEPNVEVEKATVISCHDDKGRKQNRCDTPDLQDTLLARFKALAHCKAGVDGKLSLGLKLDFEKNKVVDAVQGKSTTLDSTLVGELLACAKTELSTVSLAGIDHLQQRYLIFYTLSFSPAGAIIAEPNATALTVVPASGTATVVFESAMVRDRADSAGKIVTRLLYGTRVFVTGRVGDWYEIKYDSKGRKGFVHQNSLGMQQQPPSEQP
jgi:hypothetical protein